MHLTTVAAAPDLMTVSRMASGNGSTPPARPPDADGCPRLEASPQDGRRRRRLPKTTPGPHQPPPTEASARRLVAGIDMMAVSNENRMEEDAGQPLVELRVQEASQTQHQTIHPQGAQSFSNSPITSDNPHSSTPASATSADFIPPGHPNPPTPATQYTHQTQTQAQLANA